MTEVFSTIKNLGLVVSAFIPPTIWYLILPFVLFISFINIVREMR